MDWVQAIGAGGAIGMVLGATIGGMKHHMRNVKLNALSDLHIDISKLESDAVFLDAVLSIRPYSKKNAQTERIFEVITRSCNEIVQCYMMASDPGACNKGILQFKANRRLEALKDATSALAELHDSDLDIGACCAAVLDCADNYVFNMRMMN